MEERIGNLVTEVKSGILVHGCNAMGVMGAGVAKWVRDEYPDCYKTYRDAFMSAKAQGNMSLKLGDVIYHVVSKEPKFVIANAITQQLYGGGGQYCHANYRAIRKAFNSIGKLARKYDLTVNYPLIGASLAHGDWNEIENIINEELEGVDHKLWVLSESIVHKAKVKHSPR